MRYRGQNVIMKVERVAAGIELILFGLPLLPSRTAVMIILFFICLIRVHTRTQFIWQVKRAQCLAKLQSRKSKGWCHVLS